MSFEKQEDIIIKKGQELIDNETDKNIFFEQYPSLLKAYKKLFKRYNKMIKLSDNYSENVMDRNNKLQTFTKKKILENVSSTNELKKKYSNELIDNKNRIEKLSKELEDMTKKYHVLLRRNALLTKVKYINKHDE